MIVKYSSLSGSLALSLSTSPRCSPMLGACGAWPCCRSCRVVRCSCGCASSCASQRGPGPRSSPPTFRGKSSCASPRASSSPARPCALPFSSSLCARPVTKWLGGGVERRERVRDETRQDKRTQGKTTQGKTQDKAMPFIQTYPRRLLLLRQPLLMSVRAGGLVLEQVVGAHERLFGCRGDRKEDGLITP